MVYNIISHIRTSDAAPLRFDFLSASASLRFN